MFSLYIIFQSLALIRSALVLQSFTLHNVCNNGIACILGQLHLSGRSLKYSGVVCVIVNFIVGCILLIPLKTQGVWQWIQELERIYPQRISL